MNLLTPFPLGYQTHAIFLCIEREQRRESEIEGARERERVFVCETIFDVLLLLFVCALVILRNQKLYGTETSRSHTHPHIHLHTSVDEKKIHKIMNPKMITSPNGNCEAKLTKIKWAD